MSTNFYRLKTGDHIGKRSGAGQYCWDCNSTLNQGGIKQVHIRADSFESCPFCGKFPAIDIIEAYKTRRPKGVYYACSFIWAVLPYDIINLCNTKLTSSVIKDEYNAKYTGKEWLDMYNYSCAMNFMNIGEIFC